MNKLMICMYMLNMQKVCKKMHIFMQNLNFYE